MTYLPLLQSVFETVAVPFLDGVLVVATGVVFFAIIEIEKQLRLTLSPSVRSNDTRAEGAQS
jgi:hypothetical protein